MGTLCRERNCKVKRKRYSRKFQRMAVERMETCEDVGELARELGVRPRCLYKWRVSWRWLNQDKKRRGRARTNRLTASKFTA